MASIYLVHIHAIVFVVYNHRYKHGGVSSNQLMVIFDRI